MDSIMDLYAPIQAVQAQNNAWSAEQAQKAMDYQTYMSNTAHQREVEDLKKAGLNPVLSAGGSGASTTSGIAAQAGNENVTALYGLMGKALQANIDQAKSMQNAAKYISDASKSASDMASSVALYKGVSKDKNSIVGDGIVDFDNAFIDGVYDAGKDFLKRKLGISGDSVDKMVDSLGLENLSVDKAIDFVKDITTAELSSSAKSYIDAKFKAKEKEKSKTAGSAFKTGGGYSGSSGKFAKGSTKSFAKS